MEAAFELAAGYAPALLGELIRGLIASLIVLWGVWVCWNSYKLVGEERLSIGDWGAITTKTILLVVFVLIIVAI
jgi:integrating conjugative element protein (TIGR03758 family)